MLTLYYYNIIIWDHRRICGPSLTETSLCGAYLYYVRILKKNHAIPQIDFFVVNNYTLVCMEEFVRNVAAVQTGKKTNCS